MKKIKLLQAMLLSGLLLTSSCSEFLERQSQDEVIVKTATDFGELLLGAGYVTMVQYESLYFMDDDIEIVENAQYNETFPAYQRYGALTWQPNLWEREYALKDSYSDSYNRIMGVNAQGKRIKKIWLCHLKRLLSPSKRKNGKPYQLLLFPDRPSCGSYKIS